jgi:hypothetical protein
MRSYMPDIRKPSTNLGSAVFEIARSGQSRPSWFMNATRSLAIKGSGIGPSSWYVEKGPELFASDVSGTAVLTVVVVQGRRRRSPSPRRPTSTRLSTGVRPRSRSRWLNAVRSVARHSPSGT